MGLFGKWDPIKDIDKGLKRIGKNVEDQLKRMERAGQQTFETLAQVGSGNLNNLPQSLLQPYATAVVGEEQAKNIVGETGTQRAEREAKEKMKAQELAGIKAQEDEKNRAVASFLQSLANQKSRSPGRMQTLLTAPGAAQNTLLTLR